MTKNNQPETIQNKWLKVSQFFAAYLVAAWTFLQFLDWILKRYNVSPHWVDLMLWLFIGIIPSLLIYLYHRERINKRVFRRREKIIFPLNAVVLTIVLYFGFGNNDLGATTQSISYSTSLGENKTAIFTKEEFRAGFAICNFEPLTKDSSLAWMEFGISKLLDLDLSQNKNLNPEIGGYKSTTDKVNYTKLFYDSYVDGQFEVTDSLYVISAFIRNSSNAKVMTQKTYKGIDLFNLVDSITVFITNHYTPIRLNKPEFIDLNVKDFTSHSLRAVEYYTKGDYENAIKADSTFALAYLNYAKYKLIYSVSKIEERSLADKAFEYREKLPIQKQNETLIYKNLAWDKFENAEELVKIQLAIDPSDPTYNKILYTIYGKTKNIKAFVNHAFKAWENKHSGVNADYYIIARLVNGDYNKIIKEINMLELLELNNNEVFTLKIAPQLLKGDLKSASGTLNKMKLLHPDLGNLTKVYDKALAYLIDHEVRKEDLKKFEGEYRSSTTEATCTFWTENNNLLHYISNQIISPLIIGGENTVVRGHTLDAMTLEYTFYNNENNEFYLFKAEQNYISKTDTFWLWKIDDIIKKAEVLLEAGKLDSALADYTTAVIANPKHYYLKDALTHINYVKSTDSIALINQYKEVEGTYGPRIFWIDDGKLFFKQTDNINLGQMQLLPISENRYISLTRIGTNYDFEYEDGKAVASYTWIFNCKKMEWVKSDRAKDYFRKDENEPGSITTP